MRAELLMETRDVNSDRLRADEESGGDLPVREALGSQREHVELTRRRLVSVRLTRAARLGRDTRAPRELVSEGAQWSSADAAAAASRRASLAGPRVPTANSASASRRRAYVRSYGRRAAVHARVHAAQS
jgi:hypothetical protein